MKYTITVLRSVHAHLGFYVAMTLKLASTAGNPLSPLAAEALQRAYDAAGFDVGAGARLLEGSLSVDSYERVLGNLFEGTFDMLTVGGAESSAQELLAWWRGTVVPQVGLAKAKDSASRVGEVAAAAVEPVRGLGAGLLLALGLVLAILVVR